MKHLFLDDRVERHVQFQDYLNWRQRTGLGPQGVDFCFSAAEAIDCLNRYAYDSVFLDHDLGTDPIDGRTVAKHMQQLPPDKVFGLQVIIHSTNTIAAAEMVALLADVGMEAKAIAWPRLIEQFKRAGMK